jgi:hypothetical protein
VSDLFVTGHNTKLFDQSFTRNGVLICSKLSSEIKNIEPITKFKKILFNFLIEKSFYSVEEFTTVDFQLLNFE